MLDWGSSIPGPVAFPSSALIKGPGFLCFPLESGSGRVGKEEGGHLYSPVLSPQRPQASSVLLRASHSSCCVAFSFLPPGLARLLDSDDCYSASPAFRPRAVRAAPQPGPRLQSLVSPSPPTGVNCSLSQSLKSPRLNVPAA